MAHATAWKRSKLRGGERMSLSHRSKLGFLCLIAALLFPRPAHAEQEGQTLWDKGAAELMELAEKARHLKIPAFLLPSLGEPVDVSALEQKLNDLKENIDYAKNPPPGIGAFFDQQRSTVVSQLLINGPAERGGINIGDEFLQVNGHDVSDSMGIGHWAGQASPIEITLKGRPSKVIVTKKIPELLSPGLLKEIEDEFKAVKTATEDLKRRILSPESDAMADNAMSREIDARISRLSDKLLNAQTKLYRKA